MSIDIAAGVEIWLLLLLCLSEMYFLIFDFFLLVYEEGKREEGEGREEGREEGEGREGIVG